MRFGYLSINTHDGIRPDVLARELEDRGYDSLWVAEHTHIPVALETRYPAGGDPTGVAHIMDPFASLVAAAGATTSLTLATGVCLVLEHDVLDLACSTATVDLLSGGRLLLGVGVGWNPEELADHEPDLPWALRYEAMRERVAALRVAWQEEESEFSGRWTRFRRSWVYPKPPRGTVPVALGTAGRIGLRHAAAYADEWCPIDGTLRTSSGEGDVAGALRRFRELVIEAGRDPATVPISIFAYGTPPPQRLESYAELGVERVVLYPPTFDRHPVDATLTRLDELAPLLDRFGSA